MICIDDLILSMFKAEDIARGAPGSDFPRSF